MTIFPTKSDRANFSENVFISDLPKANIIRHGFVNLFQISTIYLTTNRNFFSVVASYSDSTIRHLRVGFSQFGYFIINFPVLHDPYKVINFCNNSKSFAFVNYNNSSSIMSLFYPFNNLSYLEWRIVFYSYEKPSSFNGFESIGAFSGGIGSFLSNSNRRFHVFGLFFRGFPQISSGPPQNPCESRHYDSSRGADKTVMDLNPSGNRNDGFFKDDEERDYFIQGAFLIGWVILWIIFVIWVVWKDSRLT